MHPLTGRASCLGDGQEAVLVLPPWGGAGEGEGEGMCPPD